MTTIALASWAAVATVSLTALAVRGRSYAAFSAIRLSVHTLIVLALFRYLDPLPLGFTTVRAPWLPYVFGCLHGLVYVQALVLSRPRMMGLPYRALCSVPALTFTAGTILALPWAVASAFGATPHGFVLAYFAALVGLVQSLRPRVEQVDVVVADGTDRGALDRCPVSSERSERPLRVVQITDPHLGPFMSVARLRRIVERAVEREPDLVLLTGDFLTMESQRDPGHLATALEPLAPLAGKTFACRGNHDLEAPETVQTALDRVGVRLLVDCATSVDTPAGRVQIVGHDYAFRRRKERMDAVAAACPRQPGVLRLVLLHDPGAFKHLQPGDADLALSGHTHGGQVGLVSLGLTFTLMRLFVQMPDHGLWARGTDRLYVHRGTGHYGFPLRIGVPAEDSLLRIHAHGAWSETQAQT